MQLKSVKFNISLIFLLSFCFTLKVSYSQQENGFVNKKDSGSLFTDFKLKEKSSRQIQKNDINYIKVSVITGVTAGAFWWLHNYQANSWWKDQRGPFHFQNDWAYSLSADKIGHFFDGYFIQALYEGAFQWAGFKKTSAMWMGAGFSILYMTDIEVEDGFATTWGFSPGDEICNITGALYPIAQYYVPPLQNFNFKWSYYPSEEISTGKKNGAFLDDYNGQTMWMTVDVNNMLPKKAKKYWPEILNLCFGYGVDNYTDFANRYQNWYIGLDLNWEKIIPGDSSFMMWFKHVINHFRFLPLPAIRFNPHGVHYVVNY
jgi:hypothetical protein